MVDRPVATGTSSPPKTTGGTPKASKRDEKGYASLSEVGQRASSRSSFDARNYGFTRLSDLVASLPQFASERREGGMVFIKRVR